MLDVPENLCVPLLTVTPLNAAAADILLTPSPPKKIDRRAAAAGQNHPARRRRNTDVGTGLYAVVLIFECLPTCKFSLASQATQPICGDRTIWFSTDEICVCLLLLDASNVPIHLFPNAETKHKFAGMT